jgi:predicted acyl esterase
MTHHGGILSTFWANWYDMQVKTVQYGLGERGARSRVTGALVCGDETLSDERLAANRCNFGDEILAHPFDDDWHRARSPRWDRVTVPFLSAANWGGQGLHPRGNFEGFLRAASPHKWLEAHGLEHWTHFYTDYGRRLQLRFFDHFLKGIDNGQDRAPPVLLQVRHVDRFVERAEQEWPIARTRWTKLHLDPSAGTLEAQPPARASSGTFEAMGDGITFLAAPSARDTDRSAVTSSQLRRSTSGASQDLTSARPAAISMPSAP